MSTGDLVAIPEAHRPLKEIEKYILVDEIVCVLTPVPFYAVGLCYEDFQQTTDQEVRDLLEHSLRAKSQAVR